MQQQYSNHLIHESSPYLLQHAHNPVEWFPWGELAFEKARKEDKPILISIGYAACHWCHVMEHESFENVATAGFMNTYFVNIKVDREERPDLDHIYMNTCQLLTGAGGWPLNVFLTPELLPFSAGTYFPPKPGYGKPSWLDVLMYMKNVFTNERDKVEQQAQSIREHLFKMDQSFIEKINIPEGIALFTKEELITTVTQLKKQFDTEDGGFGSAPKFPGSMSLLFLLRVNFFHKDEAVQQHIHLSLNKMMFGGIYDHIGGGFARYTVDKKWMIPHFEKMLYDNALLISLYSEAYREQPNNNYKRVIENTLAFVEREWMTDEGGFYASYDADSEGVEGKFYTFTYNELQSILKENFALAEKVYQIKEDGNWEHTNILFRNKTNDEHAEEMGISVAELNKELDAINKQLFDYRENRIKPGLDNKIILSWNALMCSGYVQAYKALGNEHYKSIAIKNLEFMLSAFVDQQNAGVLLHTYSNGIAKYPAFIDDYAALICALLDVYEITNQNAYLTDAIQYTAYLQTAFKGADGMYFFTPQSQTDIPIRSKDFYDNATPCGNSIMVNNLIRLAVLTGNKNYYEQAETMLQLIKNSMLKYGNSFGNWLNAALTFVFPIAEIGITGNNAAALRDEVFGKYYPNSIIQIDEIGDSKFPLLENRYTHNQTQLFLCRNNTCALPVSNVQDFTELLNKF